ncbi:MAG: hypothetical protein KZQ77_09595 [Candidatus Thiodiazotropha sp. (ex Notomyrtea botanica)]|nr:hypothetical protein [Candidatus Thiodiazotropha sp. (ex Notomyrtea botanica)]
MTLTLLILDDQWGLISNGFHDQAQVIVVKMQIGLLATRFLTRGFQHAKQGSGH